MRTRTRATTRRLAAIAMTAAVVGTATLGIAAPAWADDETTIDFTTGYTIGADKSRPNYPAGENGWTATLGYYDWDVVDNAAFPDSSLATSDPDGASLRFSSWISNTNQYSNFIQLASPRIDPAGEPSTGAVSNTFETSFVIDSATGALQPRLSVEVAIDNGTGSRSGGRVLFVHGVDGLQIATVGATPGGAAATASDWVSQYSAYYDATVAHTIRIVSTYVTDGPDRIAIYIDGGSTPILEGDTFEEYHAAATPPSTAAQRQSAALMFRVVRTVTHAPGSVTGFPDTTALTSGELADLLGGGFLFSDITYSTYNTVPSTPPADIPPTAPAASPSVTLELDEEEAEPDDELIAEATGMTPGELVGFTHYSTPTFLGYAIAGPTGVATLSFTPPASAGPGAHTVVGTGVTSGRVATSSYTLITLAVTGAEISVPLLGLGGFALLAGVGAVVAVRLRSRSSSGRI